MMFSVIIPHYEGAVKHHEFRRCIASLRAQPSELYEALVYHDGPETRPVDDVLRDMPVKFRATHKRYNDWGHSLRDKGIKEARGEYIIHLNADNALYPDVLYRLAEFIDATNHKDAYILPVRMMGLVVGEVLPNGRFTIEAGTTYDSFVLRGTPVFGGIDAMQLVMKRQRWMDFGGWSDKRMNSDGILYEHFCKEIEYVNCPLLIGEHY